MAEPTKAPVVPLLQSFDPLGLIRLRIREAIQDVLVEELENALGADRHERSPGRRGYRNGREEREVTTEHGKTKLTIPRGRLFEEDGTSREWRSEVLPRYQRRTGSVDAAIVGAYLAGANTRRIRKALEPLLGSKHLSKSAISRVVGKLKARFEEWRARPLGEEDFLLLTLDAMYLPVRMARRVVKVPVMAVLGTRRDGRRMLVSLEICGSESTASWRGVVEDLSRRGLPAPAMVTTDGNPGLLAAIREAWPAAQIQRCTNHKRENLLSKAPEHCHGELKRDYRAMIQAQSRQAALAAYDSFLKKWRTLVPAVAKSLEEAGEELLTFTRFPRSQWKCLRTTNRLERLNAEFRRRTKTQGSFPNESSALVLLWALVALGHVTIRRINGWRDLTADLVEELQRAA